MSRELPRAFGDAVLTASFRNRLEDFFVEELPAFEPGGEGEHLLLTIEKRGMNTAFAAKRIAAWAKLPEHAIGYAGLKDRHAITRQRFSVHLPKRVAPEISSLQSVDLRVIESIWHNRKLPRGALAGNRFVLVLRDVAGERAAIEQRLRDIADGGLPNWFGEQRFGRDGGNVTSALAMFSGRRVRRDERSILLSAARSRLFNRVLAARIAAGNWNQAMDGEVWMLAGSRSVFGPEPFDETLQRRLAEFDIHPSGALWGAGELRSTGACRVLEMEALASEDAQALRAGLEQAELKQERRALRQRAGDLAWEWMDDGALQLSFTLPPGSYATALLHELGEVSEARSQSRED